MATIQVRIDDNLKSTADSLFNSLGLDTSTAVRIFLTAAVDSNGIPFPIKRINERILNDDLSEAMDDVKMRRNLHGPYQSAEEAVRSMLEE